MNSEARMKATILILATLAFTASAMFTPPKQHVCIFSLLSLTEIGALETKKSKLKICPTIPSGAFWLIIEVDLDLF